MPRLAVLASGGGSNLQALLDAERNEGIGGNIVLVVSDVPGALALARAERVGVKAVTLPPKQFADRAAWEEALWKVLQDHAIDWVLLAGFMRILGPTIIRAYEGRMLNIHPSLLPKHGGKGMYGHHVHEAVLAAGDSESGATVHQVVLGCDEGPIVAQTRVPVYPDDTAQTLAARVLEQEHRLYPQAVRTLLEAEA